MTLKQLLEKIDEGLLSVYSEDSGITILHKEVVSFVEHIDFKIIPDDIKNPPKFKMLLKTTPEAESFPIFSVEFVQSLASMFKDPDSVTVCYLDEEGNEHFVKEANIKDPYFMLNLGV